MHTTTAFFKGYLAEPQSADEQAKIEEYIQVLGQRFKHILHHLEQKSIKKLHCRLEEESQHKLHRFEQKLKPFDCLQIADGGTLGLSAWWLGGNDMHQEGAWSWPRWKLRFIFR